MRSRLEVTYTDEIFQVELDDSLTFGRRAELILDDSNQFMHRITGTFLPHLDSWWLRNDGRTTEMAVATEGGRQSVIPAGQSDPLLGPGGTIRVQAGLATYELVYSLSDSSGPPTVEPQRTEGTRTVPFAVIRLNPDQRVLLTALAEPWLLDPLARPLSPPPNAHIAHELGWTSKKLDRKLDYLCDRFHRQGVAGLRGSIGNEANARRQRLVRHVLESGMIANRDLALLESARSDQQTTKQTPEES